MKPHSKTDVDWLQVANDFIAKGMSDEDIRTYLEKECRDVTLDVNNSRDLHECIIETYAELDPKAFCEHMGLVLYTIVPPYDERA